MQNISAAAPLLSPKERAECTEIVEQKIVLISQRAQALLLVDGGKSHREVVKLTGLSIGQVRYAINRFRKIGTKMFASAEASEEITDVDLLPPVSFAEKKKKSSDKKEPSKVKKKDKKSKKDKEKKKEKKKKKTEKKNKEKKPKKDKKKKNK